MSRKNLRKEHIMKKPNKYFLESNYSKERIKELIKNYGEESVDWLISKYRRLMKKYTGEEPGLKKKKGA